MSVHLYDGIRVNTKFLVMLEKTPGITRIIDRNSNDTRKLLVSLEVSTAILVILEKTSGITRISQNFLLTLEKTNSVHSPYSDGCSSFCMGRGGTSTVLVHSSTTGGHHTVCKKYR